MEHESGEIAMLPERKIAIACAIPLGINRGHKLPGSLCLPDAVIPSSHAEEQWIRKVDSIRSDEVTNS